MMFPNVKGMPVYINPFVGPDCAVLHNRNSPQAFLVVDSRQTLDRILAAINEKFDVDFLRACGIKIEIAGEGSVFTTAKGYNFYDLR